MQILFFDDFYLFGSDCYKSTESVVNILSEIAKNVNL